MQIPNRIIVKCYQDNIYKDGILLDIIHYNGGITCIIMLNDGKLINTPLDCVTINNHQQLININNYNCCVSDFITKTKYKIITLCGSTKFKDKFIEIQKKLTLEGKIVISVGCFGHSGDDEVWNDNTKEMLDNMHKAKIDLADEIFVINVDNYIGESTKSEIAYALRNNKPIKYLE